MIVVVMTTWDDGTGIRAGYAHQAVSSLLDNLTCTTEPVSLHIADDGTENVAEFYMPLLDIIKSKWGNAGITTPPHNGIGSSLNHALARVEPNDYWMYTTDDWVLTDELCLDQAIQLLHSGYDYVRLGPVHPNLECITRFQQGIGWWIEILNNTGFAFATRPFIATRRFYDKVGAFLEGTNSYVVEQDYSLRCTRMRHSLNMAAVNLHGPWTHVGDYAVGYMNV